MAGAEDGTGTGDGASTGAGAGRGGGAEFGGAADWIEASAESWMSVTYAEFYFLMVDNKLRPEQWRAYCADIAGALLYAGGAVAAGRIYACFALQAGHTVPSTSGVRLAEIVKNGGVSASWTLLTALHQAWFVVRAPSKQSIPAQYVATAVHASDPDAAGLVEAAAVALDNLLTNRRTTATERTAARATFDNVLRALVAVLENALAVGDNTAAVLCRCGRPGHLESQCTFKSTLIPK